MGSHSFVKSESWLDVSRIVQREEEQQNDQQSERRSSQLADKHQTRRRPIERALSLEPTDRNQNNNNNRQEHLLIRLRQQSFLARSNSTTLSSNLSHSVDLDGSLVDQSNSFGNFRQGHTKCEGSTSPTHHQINSTRRELSFGLKSFRDRFERRWQQMRHLQARKQANHPNSDPNRHRSRETSPFARSWSSLSEQVSSRLTNIGHACKSLLYECQKPHCDSSQLEPDERRASQPNATRPMSPMATRSPVNLNDSDQLNVSTFRRRLTSQWVAQQYEAQRGELELELAVEDEDQNQLIRPPIRESNTPTIELQNRSAIRHATPTPSDDCKPQPRSVSSRRESSRTSRSSREATGGKHEAECKLASHFFSAQAGNGAAELSSPLTQRSHSTSSSTTLVSVTKRQPQQSQSPPIGRLEDKRNSPLPALERLLRLQTNSSSNTFSSSSSTKTTMSSNVSQQTRGKFGEKLAQVSRNSPTTPVATSDYWSSVKSELAPSMAPIRDHHHQSDQFKRNQRNFEPTPILSMANDQDYYLDVATAANFQQQQAVDMQQQQQQLFDPHTNQEPAFLTAEFDDYDDYAVPADESCCRLERSQVELVQLIGEGQKGYVFVGKLQSKDGQSIIDVAIKTLKFETEQLIERLMNEAAMMKQLEHPHIIKFIGMCPETPALIAMELAKFGEIKHYFRLNRQLIKCSQLVLFSFQISTALSYLESKNYVHRDVAARNVLVCSHNCVKLADFGLSRNLQVSNYSLANSPQNTYNQQNDLLNQHQHHHHHHQNNQQDLYVAAPRVKLPVRWLAPESLVFRRFTSASDVWMFAVCTWEFFQLAQVRPWAELRNNQVLTAIESGQRLARPEACPERLYQLMLKCWSYAPVQRPKFREIKQCIWSIYLSERTREQLELERLEQERQQRLMLIQQQHLHQAQVPLLATSNKSRHEQLSMLACERRQSPTNSASQQAAAARLNHTPSSNYSSTLTTTTDTEQMISPCSSAFNSMAREAAQRELDKKQQQAQLSRSSALKTAISRFEQRQSPVGGASHRPHVLQKQRSQGAIGMATSRHFEEGETLVCDAANFKNRNSKANRRSGQIQPIFDDGALEYAKRIARRATNLGERRSVVPANKFTTKSAGPMGANDEDLDSEIEESDDDDEVEGALWARAQRFVSASPALTADAGSQSRVVSIEPAYDGVFSADHHNQHHTRAFLMPGDQIAMLRNNFDPSDGSRLSPQLISSPALTSSNSPTRPASWRVTPTAGNIETNNNFNYHHLDHVAAQRGASGKKPQLNPSSHNKMRVSPQPDQLGQMLQALRITPMKAKLRSSPEQNVRVLQREEKRPTFDEFERPLERHDSSKRSSIARRDQVVEPKQQPQQQQQQPDGQAKQLMLHERLLGRIRPSSSSPSPSGGLTANQRRDLGTSSQQQQQQQQRQQRRPTSQVVRDKSDAELARLQHGINSRLPHQNKSVEVVDHSLQILESLMLGHDVNGPGGPATSSSLPRRSHR